MAKVKQEKDDEANRFSQEKAKYEQRIKDLEEQIRMLRSESGDILSELERKMQMLIDNHAQEKQDIEKERQKEREDAASDA